MKEKNESSVAWKGTLLAFLFLLCPPHAVLADEWNLKDKDGIHHKLSEQKGKWVLVNFWAPWCPSCIQEIPELDALQKQHKDLIVIGVAVMYRSKKEVLDVAQAQSVSYPLVLGNEDIASDFGEMKGMPTSFLYSPTGKLVGHHDGPLTRNDIEPILEQKSDASTFFIR